MWHNASVQYGNMSALIAAVNANASYGLHLRWATVAEYFDALHAAVPAFPRVPPGLDFLLGWPHVLGIYNTTA